MPAPQKLAHVVLGTGQRAAMRDWYCKVLCAKVQFENDLLCFLTYDDEHHRIALGEMPGAQKPPPGSTGLVHVAFTFDDLADLLQTYEDLSAESISPVWCVNHGTTTSTYYADPDGNWVELQVDNFATAEEGNAYMLSDRYAANPIGVQFDPAEYLARLRNGESSAELLTELARVEGPAVGLPSFAV
jgi:catechol-2,3-dioxygenase